MFRVTLRERMQRYFSRHPVAAQLAIVALGGLVFDDGRRWGGVGEGIAAVVLLCFFVLSHPRRNDDAVDDAGLLALVVAVDVIFLGFLGYALIRRRRV